MKRLDWYLAVNHGYTHAVLLGIPVLILGLVATDGWTRAELVGWYNSGVSTLPMSREYSRKKTLTSRSQMA